MAFSRGKVLKSFFWKLFEKLSAQLIQFVVTIVLARLLSPSEYGIVALIAIFIQLIEVILDGGFSTALIQKKNADNIDFSTVFFFSLVLAGVLYAVMFFCAPVIANFYGRPELILLIRILSFSLLLFSFNSIQRAYVSKKMLFQRLFYSSLGATILSGILGIMMAYQGYGVWALVAQSISMQIFNILIMWYTVKWRPVFFFSFERFKGLFNFGWKIFGANMVTSLFVNARKMVIGKYYAPASLAFYEKGEQLPALVMNNIFASIQAIMLPTFSDSQDDKTRIKSMMRRSTKLNCFFIYPLMIGIIVAAKPLVILLYTEKWLPIVPFIQILCIANFFRPITISNWEAIKAMGYSGIILKLEIIKKVIDLIILIVSVSIGVFAIAWGCVLFNFFCVFINLAPNKKLLNYGVREQVVDALPTFLISLTMGVSICWIQLLELPLLLILCMQFLLGVGIYIILSRIVKEESLMYIIEIIKNYKTKLLQKS